MRVLPDGIKATKVCWPEEAVTFLYKIEPDESSLGVKGKPLNSIEPVGEGIVDTVLPKMCTVLPIFVYLIVLDGPLVPLPIQVAIESSLFVIVLKALELVVPPTSKPPEIKMSLKRTSG